MKKRIEQTAWMVLGIFIAEMTVPFGGTLALADSGGNSYCDAFCGRIIQPGTDHLMNLAGNGRWSQSDAQTCSSWSSTKFNPTAIPSPLPSPWPSTSAMQFQCQWESNSQAADQCMAYEANSQTGGEGLMITMDIAAAGVCAAACWDPDITATTRIALEKACSAASLAASATDVIMSLIQKSSPVGKAINAAAGAAGLAVGTMGLVAATGAKAINGATTTSTATFDAGMGYQTSITTSTTTKAVTNAGAQKGHTMSCATSIMMAAMAALRATNLGNSEESKQTACNNIEALSSGANTAGRNPTTLPTMSGTNNGGGAQGGSTGASNLGNGGPVTGVACVEQGLSNCGLSAEQLNQPDAAALSSGLAQPALPPAMAMQNAGFNPASSGDVGSALNSAAGGGQAGQALQGIADAVKANAGELNATGGDTVAKAGAAPGNTSAANPFSFDFGKQGGGAMAASDMKFGGRAPASGETANDIWHAAEKNSSIFAVLSNAIRKNSSRVQKSDYVLPLNRAME